MFITRGAGPLLAIRRSTLLRHSHIDTSCAIKKMCMTVQDDSLYKKESSNMTQLLACALH